MKTKKQLEQDIIILTKALEVAHADLIKWGSDANTGEMSQELLKDMGKISYALNTVEA